MTRLQSKYLTGRNGENTERSHKASNTKEKSDAVGAERKKPLSSERRVPRTSRFARDWKKPV